MSVDTILHNAKIATNQVPSFVEAVAISGGKISAAGKNEDILRLGEAGKLQAEGPGKILLADVRSYGYYSAAAFRIPGSIRIEPNNLSAELKQFPRNKDMYLYCTCRGQTTSASVAHLLRQQGFSAFVIDGGLAAWRRAGNPLESVPTTDLVHLPTFSR